MSLLSLRDIAKSYGPDLILSEVTFQADAGDRIGIVGENGAGKTTLFKMILGEEKPDSGEISRARAATLGYLEQHYRADPARSVIDEAMGAFAQIAEIDVRLRALEHEMALPLSDGEMQRVLEKHARLSEDFERQGGYLLRPRAEEMLLGLGIDPSFFERPMGTLSGGEGGRVALARLLLSAPDLMLLDEPTNHLDIDGCEWLENYLASFPGTFLVISHDRWFLDRVTTHTLEVGDGTVRLWNGNFSHFELQKSEERKAAERAFLIQQDYIRKEREFIRKHMGSQRTREAKGRLKRLNRLELLLAPGHDPDEMKMRLDPKKRLGNDVFELDGVSKSFGGRTLFADLEFRIEKGERFGIIGPNGAGKSTLLKVLLGRETADSGRVKTGITVDLGYYDQRHEGLDPRSTPFDTIAGSDVQRTELEVRSYLARFLFFDDQLHQKIESLSGGERGRLLLARLLLLRPNVLMLDEPTNHLDVYARQALEEALDEFRGTLIVVSHDRYFLDKLCTRVLFVDGADTRIYGGNYSFAQAARSKRRAEAAARATAEKAAREVRIKAPPPARKVVLRSIERIEADILEAESKKNRLNEDLGVPKNYMDPAKVKAIKAALEKLDQDLRRLEDEFSRHL